MRTGRSADGWKVIFLIGDQQRQRTRGDTDARVLQSFTKCVQILSLR